MLTSTKFGSTEFGWSVISMEVMALLGELMSLTLGKSDYSTSEFIELVFVLSIYFLVVVTMPPICMGDTLDW